MKVEVSEVWSQCDFRCIWRAGISVLLLRILRSHVSSAYKIRNLEAELFQLWRRRDRSLAPLLGWNGWS